MTDAQMLDFRRKLELLMTDWRVQSLLMQENDHTCDDPYFIGHAAAYDDCAQELSAVVAEMVLTPEVRA